MAKSVKKSTGVTKAPKGESYPVLVLKRFRDKNDHKTWYDEGEIILGFPAERANNVIERGLAEEYNPEADKDKDPGGEGKLNPNSDGDNSTK